MPLRLNPYLSFRDNAREAMEFYQSVFGGSLDITTFGGMSMPGIPDEYADRVMHAMLSTAAGEFLMGADTPPHMDVSANGSQALSGDGEAQLTAWWDALSEGASVHLPLAKAPWGDSFGQLTDRFGVSWMVNIEGSAG